MVTGDVHHAYVAKILLSFRRVNGHVGRRVAIDDKTTGGPVLAPRDSANVDQVNWTSFVWFRVGFGVKGAHCELYRGVLVGCVKGLLVGEGVSYPDLVLALGKAAPNQV